MNKKYFKYIILPFFVLATWSCNKDTKDERPVTEIEFNFISEGEAVDTLSFSSNAQKAEVGVSLNNENLYWTVTSDKSWCVVTNGTGRGSGTVELELALNESFEPRDTAVLTFTAGGYTEEKTLAIVQLGSDFILSQSLFLSQRNGQIFTNITVKADTSDVLTVSCPEWVTYNKIREVVSKNLRTTVFTLTTTENTSEARTAYVYFSKDGGETCNSSAYIYQFGNEMNYNESGYMLMPSGQDSTIYFDVPKDILKLDAINSGHSGKDYVNFSAIEGSEYTTVAITFENNLNDCMENRTASKMFLTLNNKARAVVPTFYQPYESCYGINTAKGLLNFARAVNTGADISPWQKDGVVHILTGIDMSTVTNTWPGIGNETHPFTGKFDGGFYPISSFTTNQPLFGVCDGADIQSVTLDESNKFQFSEDPSSETGIALASIAGKVNNTVINYCTSSAAVTLAKTVPGDNVKIYVAGIVGFADASSSVTNCENFGKITVTSGLETASEDNLYLAGIAGYSGGPVKNCVSTGAIADGAAVYRHYIGGICGYSTAVIEKCESSGAISITSVRVNPTTGLNDQSRYIYAGGINGATYADINNCTNSASITSSSNVKFLYIGGISSIVATPNFGPTNINSGDITSSGDARYLYIGGLYAYVKAEQNFKFDPDTETSLGNITIKGLENTSDAYLCAGGYVGVITGAPLTIENAVWSKEISATLNTANHVLGYLAVGGILGGSIASLASSNPQDVKINNCQCVNSDITFTLSGSYTFGAYLGTIAGIVGTINGNAEITNCTTTGTMYISSNSKTNSRPTIMSGIAGAIVNGNAIIKECTNNIGMRNWAYNNNAWSSTLKFDSGYSVYTANVVAGILGSYLGPENPNGYNIEIENCTNNGYVYSYRGLAGGIVGYVRDAKIRNCTNTGSLGSGNRYYVGGIACLANNTEITGCSAKCLLTAQHNGSGYVSAGGIISIALGTGSISGCSYYGDITNNSTEIYPQEAWGAVIGHTVTGGGTGLPSYTISSSKWGGTYKNQLTDPIEITVDNYRDYAVGQCSYSQGSVTVSDDCEWWNGE